MIAALIKIRFRQLFRSIAAIGFFRIIFLALLIGVIMTFVFSLTKNSTDALYVVGFNVLIILWIQMQRNDKLFLQINFENHRLIYFAEYVAFSLPVITLLIIHLKFISFLILLAAFALIALIEAKQQQRSLNSRLQSAIPHECFEWKAGSRKTFYIFVTTWLIGFLASFSVASVPVAMFIIGAIIASFHETCEPYQLIIAREEGASLYLSRKIKMQMRLYTIISAPLMVVFALFHSALWYIPVVEYLIFSSIHIYLILTKYAFYRPNKQSEAGGIIGALGILGGIIPLFLPVVWLMSIRFYFKSLKNLKFYLDDFN